MPTHQVTDLIFGAALHDIGKVVQRANNQRVKHAKLGADYLSKFKVPKVIEQQVRYHHGWDMPHSRLANDHLAYLTYLADNISSGTDRKLWDVDQEKSTYQNWDQWTNQEDIFNNLFERETRRFYEPTLLDDREEIQYADEHKKSFSQGAYAGILTRISQTLEHIDYTSDYVTSLLNLLETTLSFVPSSTNLDEIRDISLYDHSKLTAALAVAIYHYLEEQGNRDYKKFALDPKVDDEQMFQLMSFDFSGIQSFIYTITDKNAAKMLRSRSFYLEILAENLVDEIIERMGLSRANLLYSGGGGGYLVIPNTKQAQQTLSEIEKEINTFLQTEFGNELYVAFGSTSFSPAMSKTSESTMREVYGRVNREIADKKLNRYSATEIKYLNDQGKKIGRECSICHRIDEVTQTQDNDQPMRCSICEGLISFSTNLQFDDFFHITEEVTSLPLGFDKFLQTIAEKEIKSEPVSGRIYSKNRFFTGQYQSTHLWVGDYASAEHQTFSDYVDQSQGIRRLGVVRCDVDDLGLAFITGFSDRLNTLSRSTTFSRSMELFFKFYINKILDEENIVGTIIYSGGDDVFVVGEWFDMIRFSVNFRQQLIKYTQGKLTISTGIGLYPDKTPISIMARETGTLEEAAKSNGKDSICLFSPEYTYRWDDFIDNIWLDKYLMIQEFFSQESLGVDYGTAFIYKLLNLIRGSFDEVSKGQRGDYKTISWARWAYFLSQMEPTNNALKDKYRQFSQKLHHYFSNSKDAKELEMALVLYVYNTRGIKS